MPFKIILILCLLLSMAGLIYFMANLDLVVLFAVLVIIFAVFLGNSFKLWT